VSYEIHPETPAAGISLERLFGPGFRAGHRAVAARCEELGLAFQPSGVLSNSRLAVEAAEFARDAGRHSEFHRAVLSAYFAQGLDIGDAGVLREIAGKLGLDQDALGEALATGSYAGKRVAAEAEARQLGVTAVPTFIFERSTRVVGAQQIEYFRQLLREISSARETSA
jgi:predicted DsbA family dithiol-disulfide isomerase